MKKIPIYIFIIIMLAGMLIPAVKIQAQEPIYYNLLQPLPCEEGTLNCENGELTDFNPESDTAFGVYLNFAIRLFIGLCAVLAVVMIVVGGIEYSTSELISSKEAGKERIRGAVFGLMLALGAYTILFTINPDLLNTDVNITGVELTATLQDFEVKFIPVGETTNPQNVGSRGTVCDANSILAAGQAAGLTSKEAETFSCILYWENRSCVSVKNYKWQQGSRGHSAFGYFQINLIGNAPALENQACWAAAGQSPLNCRRTFSYSGTPENNVCIRAATDFNCQVAAATYLLRHRSPPFADWTVGTAEEPHTNQANCVKKYYN